MFSLRVKIFLSLLFVTVAASAQKLKKSDKAIVAKLEQHIRFLADDKLEGRRAGSEGERLAMEYIIAQFKEIGISPKGTESFPQSFIINEGKQIGAASFFKVNNSQLEPGKDFFPFPYSPDQNIEALPAIAIQEAGMPWFVDLAETLEENKNGITKRQNVL